MDCKYFICKVYGIKMNVQCISGEDWLFFSVASNDKWRLYRNNTSSNVAKNYKKVTLKYLKLHGIPLYEG